MKPLIKILIIFIIFGLLSPFQKILAQNIVFDPEYIISDNELTDYQSMSLLEIQEFLIKTDGALKDYSDVDVDGRKKTASEIIYRASQEYKINPKVIITLLQREKSLITKKSPSQDDYNWATGFTCYDYLNPVYRFRGFSRQVDRATWRFRYYLEHPWQFQFKTGIKTKTLVNGKDVNLVNIYSRFVIPKNMATSGLYNYAPHLYDNWLFWKIWENWFGQEENTLPNGSLIRINQEKGVWLIQNGERHPFYNQTVFLLNYNFKNVKSITEQEANNYPIGEPVSFPNFSLVKASNLIFMISNREKRLISEEIFKKIGYHPDEIIEVNEEDLKNYSDGEPILSPYPSGALLQDNKTKSVYYVKENFKYPIVDASILKANFPYSYIIKIDSKELANFELGDQIKFKDGTLIKSDENPAVYVIKEGKKMPILSEDDFETLGYQWESILETKASILDTYPIDENLII